MDKYQERYLKHQENKKKSLSSDGNREHIKHDSVDVMKLFESRKSQRIFNGEVVTSAELDYILGAINTSPSSCNRKGVEVEMVFSDEEKSLLNEWLVGGVGWIDKADKIILLWANMEAYKSPAEVNFMPWLDAGVMVQSGYLASEAIGVGCCFVNPNIRDKNKQFFSERFGNKLFCGALILGKY